MNDKELADRIVALGVLLSNGNGRWRIAGHPWEELNDEEAVRDWRVAGALMEQVEEGIEYTRYHDWQQQGKESWKAAQFLEDEGPQFTDDSLPRAICEACVEALQATE